MKNAWAGLFTFLLPFLWLTACKKDKVFTVQGRLLLSRSQPVPVRDYKLSLYQRGSGGAPIAMGTSSSFADGRTNSEGYFQIRFREGGGTFLGIPTRNQSAVTLSGNYETTLPNFQVLNFPYVATASAEPLYLYKKVDSLFILLQVFSPIAATDSFTIYANDLSGNRRWTKKGLTAAVNTEVVIDTILGAVFPVFDHAANKYINDVAVYKAGHFMQLSLSPGQDSLSVQDEQSLTLRFRVF